MLIRRVLIDGLFNAGGSVNGTDVQQIGGLAQRVAEGLGIGRTGNSALVTTSISRRRGLVCSRSGLP